MPVLEGKNLSHAFSYRFILHHADVTIEQGENVALTGVNGAGKTTLLRILATLLHPTAGRVTWFNNDLGTDLRRIRRRIGYFSSDTSLYGDLSVEENLFLYATLYDLSQPKKCVAMWLDRVGMKGFEKRPVAQLSQGERQRVSLVRSLMHKPTLWFWDEPTSGLDTKARQLLGELVQEDRSAHSVVCATHDLNVIQSWIDRTVRIENGRLQ